MTIKAYATQSATTPLAPFEIERRAVGPHDVQIDILFCGVCHSDLHQARNEWGNTQYPCVPGHEIVGRVTAVGDHVRKFAVGDVAAVGCMVDSCQHCPACDEGLEQYCENGFTLTYNGNMAGQGENTLGGYSQRIVVTEGFVLKVSHSEDQLAAVAPLLCAGITTYSPLKHWGAGPGKKIGIVGIGGLGHMGVKLAKMLGAHVVAFTTSPGKKEAALALGADEVVVSKNEDEMAAHANSFDMILDTVAASHNLDAFVALLHRDGTLVLVGAPEHPHPSPQVFGLMMGRKSIAGSAIGSIAETQEMLDLCARHNVVSDVEMIGIQDIETAYDRLARGDVRYRFVIDNQTLAA
ncbi:NAD(P)-dependent alcohol dehydrogenase [Sphingomonas sp.]|uniref:NAD(P)-dependent alcohol dehydrogenase n=1 Tax=Sphingomonas sp. TaxID=28214 RepID=UPI003B3A9A31